MVVDGRKRSVKEFRSRSCVTLHKLAVLQTRKLRVSWGIFAMCQRSHGAFILVTVEEI